MNFFDCKLAEIFTCVGQLTPMDMILFILIVAVFIRAFIW